MKKQTKADLLKELTDGVQGTLGKIEQRAEQILAQAEERARALIAEAEEASREAVDLRDRLRAALEQIEPAAQEPGDESEADEVKVRRGAPRRRSTRGRFTGGTDTTSADEKRARLAVRNMAATGVSREELVGRVDARFEVDDPEQLVDEVLGQAERV